MRPKVSIVVMVRPVHRVARHIRQRVVHPAHVPFIAKAQAAPAHWPGDLRPGRRFLGDGDRAGNVAVDPRVQVSRMKLTASRFSRPPWMLGTHSPGSRL